MEQVEFESGTIRALAYDDASRACEVRFASGRVYRYAEVPRSVFDWWMRSPGKGAFFNRKVRDVYAFTELAQPSPPAPDLLDQLRASLGHSED